MPTLGSDPGASVPLLARAMLWAADEILCVAAAAGAVLGGAGLASWSDASTGLRVGLGLAVAYVVVACYTLSVYLQRRRREILGVFAGERPLTRTAPLILEVQKLTLLQLASLVVDGLKIGLAILCFTAFVLDNLIAALAVFSICVALVCKLDALGGYLREKAERFFGWDGVVVVPLRVGMGEPTALAPTLPARLLAWMDRCLDDFLFPPLTWAEPAYLELVKAEVHVDPALPCRVCGQRLEEAPVVVCGACATPHHADCFSYVGSCAVYGCGATHSRPAALGGAEPTAAPAPAPAATSQASLPAASTASRKTDASG